MEAVTRTGPARPYGITSTPLTYDPPVSDPATDLPIVTVICNEERPGLESYKLQAKPARQLVNLVDVPVLVVTTESGYHAVYDHCTVEYLRQAGVKAVEHLELAKVGVMGNGHFMFMEKNNLEIAGLVEKWINSVASSSLQE